MNLAARFFQRLRSLGSFVAIPLLVVFLFLVLAAVTYKLDAALSKELVKQTPILTVLENLFGDRQSTRSLLGTIASAMITVTSITFSLLLVAVQQAAASFSNQILQQFRTRKTNQFYFGFFVGLSLYTLITLATTRDVHHPLFGALISIVLTVIALLLIIVLIFTTIEQMRGSSVINEIVSNIRHARDGECKLLAKTRRTATEDLPVRLVHSARDYGTVTGVAIDSLSKSLKDCAPDAELVICATEGVYVGRGDRLAELRSPTELTDDACAALRDSLEAGFDIGTQPGLGENPQVGVDQLATIAWNNTSTAVSNPHPPILICRAIRSLVWEWTEDGPKPAQDSPIVYPDLTLKKALQLLEAMGVASAESKQPQTLAELYETYAALLPRLPERERAQVEEAIRLSLGALPNHVPTQRLNGAMEHLANALDQVQSPVAGMVRETLASEKRDAAFRKDAVPAR